MAAGVNAWVVGGALRRHVEEEEEEEEQEHQSDSSSSTSSSSSALGGIGSQSAALITRDFLGSSPSLRCRSAASDFSSYRDMAERDFNSRRLKAGYPPDEDCSGLNLRLYPSSHYHGVCTLEKVRSALDRAQKQPYFPIISDSAEAGTGGGGGRMGLEERRSFSSSSSSSSSYSGSFAGACPNCLMYVLTWESNPVCPKCYSIVPKPGAPKKPRMDLNSAVMSSFDWK